MALACINASCNRLISRRKTGGRGEGWSLCAVETSLPISARIGETRFMVHWPLASWYLSLFSRRPCRDGSAAALPEEHFLTMQKIRKARDWTYRDHDGLVLECSFSSAKTYYDGQKMWSPRWRPRLSVLDGLLTLYGPEAKTNPYRSAAIR